MVKIASLPLLALASGAAAQFPFPFGWPFPRPQAGVQAPQAPQAVWGQCGGRNWNGPTTCSSGTYCRNDGNEWYSQCVPLTQDSPQRQPGSPQIITTIITVTRDGPLAPTRPVGNPNPVQPLVPPFPPAVTGTPLGQPDSPINRLQADVDDINEPAAAAPEAAAPVADAPEANVPEAAAPVADAPEANVPEAAAPVADVPEANVPEASIAARATRTFTA